MKEKKVWYQLSCLLTIQHRLYNESTYQHEIMEEISVLSTKDYGNVDLVSTTVQLLIPIAKRMLKIVAMLWLKHVILMAMDMHVNELRIFLKVKNILLGLQSKTRLITLSI